MTHAPRFERFMGVLPYLFLTPIAAILLLLGWQEINRRRTPPSPAAETYLMDAIEIIRREHMRSGRANWPDLIADAKSDIRGAKSPSDVYPAISRLLARLGENHSFLMHPGRPGREEPGTSLPEPPKPEWTLRNDGIGVVRIPQLDSFRYPDKVAGFSRSLREGIEQIDRTKLCGWIVDVRGNSGGNMWPMLAGIDPLLGEGPFGYFVRPSGAAVPWLRPFDAGTASSKETHASYRIRQADAPLAVLLDRRTMSSGEMVAIALIGRNDVRTFGSETSGYTTSNSTFVLSDGAVMAVTSTFVRDRRGTEYRGPIRPDVEVDPALAEQAAAAWLKEACMNRLASSVLPVVDGRKQAAATEL